MNNKQMMEYTKFIHIFFVSQTHNRYVTTAKAVFKTNGVF